MALLTMSQQPGTRLLDTFQFGKDKDRFGGGTSLPLNSDGYEEKQMRLREERRQEWLLQQQRGMYQHPSNVPVNPPLDYEENRKILNEERKREYMQYMEKKAKEEHSLQNQGRSFTPVGGLNIGNYDRQLKEQAAQKKKEYKEMLDQQKREQLYLRARQQPEISVIDRNTQSQYLANKPPSGPAYRPRDEPPLGPGYRPRDDSPLGQGYRPRDEPPLGQGYRPRDEPPLDQGYRPRDEAFMSDPIPDRSNRGQKLILSDSQGQIMNGGVRASRSPHPPRSPERLYQPDWLIDNEPVKLSETGTPLAFKTDLRTVAPPKEKVSNGSLFENEKLLFEKPRTPKSFKEREPEHVLSKLEERTRKKELEEKYIHQISPGRIKNTSYKDSKDIGASRKDANITRQNEYNEYLKMKAEEQQRKEETRQQLAKPKEIVKNPYYSSENYENYQHELQKKQGDDYREFLTKKDDKTAQQGSFNQIETTYGASFKKASAPPMLFYHQPSPSPALQRFGNQSLGSQDHYQVSLAQHQQQDHSQQNSIGQNAGEHQGGHQYNDNKEQLSPEAPEQQAPVLSDNFLDSRHHYNQQSPHEGYMPKMPDYLKGNPQTFHQQMMAPYPKSVTAPPEKTGSLPATPSKLSLPLGQYDDMRPFIVKQRNREYNSLKEQFDHGPKKLPDSTVLSLPIGQDDDSMPKFETQRNRNYNQNPNGLPPIRNWVGMTPKATDVSLPVGHYEKMKKIIEKQRNKEYNELLKTGRIGKYFHNSTSPALYAAEFQRSLRQKAPTPPQLTGLPIGQQNYEPMYNAMEHQRNKEYNEFLKKKYGDLPYRNTRSQPDMPSKSSLFYGNDFAQDEKRKMLEEERRNEYNKYIKEKEPQQFRSIKLPSDADSGLPIGQRHHDAWRKYLREQRNREYNQLISMKSLERPPPHREWHFDQKGSLELRGDDAVQSKQRELRAERQQDYQNYISQHKVQVRRTWPEPDDEGALLVKKGAYESVRQVYDEQWKKDFLDSLNHRREQRVANPSRRHEFVDTAAGPYNGLFQGLGEHGNITDTLNQQRKQEYSDQLSQNADAAQSSVRNLPGSDNYQQILDEKRREEANRRRYDDPEYQERLVQSDNSTARYGY